ncbi:AmmeMemoRadiSam system protein B [Methylophaga sp. OBS3]|uniref:AmmeMemoRadiSam system protein B n=1 Tax=Methylophaga sp. OBS3 TaxID=2991934 RepID=UPI0022523DAA|nr:AmmeMemoRadiSam system protein B [Methylophaga sp. OBS3]MCX4189044.1 AmmeMemoRadiSam system protein B [Methylophaga sp. OBS3]
MNTIRPTIRPSAVAGLFYPARATELETLLSQQFASLPHASHHFPRALIVPHAGYSYAGKVFAKAYQLLQHFKEQIQRVIVLGPSHRVPFKGIAISAADYFATPLGSVAVDKAAIARLSALEGVRFFESAHETEHSIEVQLPFLQYVLDQFEIVPIITGDANTSAVSQAIQTAMQDDADDTLIVVSSDLSHYLDYESARRIDQFTSQAIISLDENDIDAYHACGYVGIRGFIDYARQQHLTGKVLSLCNSGDTAGKKDSVVGYGAYVFE